MKNVQDAYPLSPMQQGMLFHSLLAGGAGAYVEQIGWTLEGRLDERAFADAWRRVVERHPVLRTAFFWEGLEAPLQVVRQRVAVDLERHDWSQLTPEEQEWRFDDLLENDRRRGFDLTRAPLQRLYQVRLAPGRHRFVWCYHHALIDGWSAPLVLREVFLFYQAFAQGRELDLEAGRPFRDYIAWTRQREAAATEAYWRRTLAGFTEPTPLPGARPATADGPLPGTVYRTERRSVPAPLTAALEGCARDRQLTLNTIFHGAWGLLLGRYADTDDVVFGGVVSGRPTALSGVDAMVGPFVNTLPVRLRLPAEQPAAAWLRQLHADQLELREHEHSPLLRVREWSELAAGRPLFETLVVYENLPADGGLPQLDGGPRVASSFRSDPRTGYPLSLEIFPGEELALHLTFDAARFEVTAVCRLLRHLVRLLAALAETPELPLGELSVLAAAERHQLLTEWARTTDAESDAVLRRGETVPELFTAQARRSPAATALVFGAAGLTFGELEARANRLAHRLRGLGVSAETPVGVCLERSVELVVALLGVWKAGGAYLPLDPAYPDARLAFLLADAFAGVAAPVVVTGTGDGERLTRLGAEVGLTALATVCLRGSDAEAAVLAALSAEPPAPAPDPGDLAYLIYTSGTTGRPKGVAVEHRQLAWVLGTARQHFDFRAGDRMPCLAISTFDIFLFELLTPLLAGGTAVLMDLRPAPDVERLTAALATMSHLHAVPALMRQIVDEARSQLAGGADFSRLRQIFVGGDRVPPELLADLRRTFPGARLRVLYGPTEGTIFCAHFPFQTGEVRGAPIGRPLPGVRLELRDRRGEPVPIGVAGEIWIGGVGVARGYLRRDELSRERFPRLDGERRYRTGDLARWWPDGNLEFLGRTDDQVKVRGFRVELGEIGAVLAEHPAVAEAVVVLRQDRPEDLRLVAYAAAPEGVSAEELREYLRRRLPEPLLPAAIVTLAALPRTSHGKVDRRALPEPPGAPDEAGYLPPRTPLEELVAATFAEVLGCERVGLHQSFFALGGHSLLATRLVSRLRGQLEVDLPLRDVFEHPEVADLAAHVESLRRRGRAPEPPPLIAADRSRPLPLSFAQQRLWLVDQLQPGSSAYKVPIALRIAGDLDVDVLGRTFTTVVCRHEALRTTFATAGGLPIQVVHPPRPLRPPLIDLAALPESRRAAEEDRRLREEMWRPADLGTGPLFRILLLRMAPQRHTLMLDLHHTISDGWSVQVLIREVAALYAASAAGTELRLPPLPIQYADFAAWQRSWLTGEVLAAELEYWRGVLGDSPEPLELPADRPWRPLLRARGDLVPVRLGRSTAALQRLGRRRGATPFMILFTAFAALLHRVTGQRTIHVGTPISGRNRREVEPLIGFFVNTLVVRSDLAGDPRFEEVLECLRETVLGAFAHQEVPFEKLVEELQPERDLSRHPLFQVAFTFDQQRPDAVGLEMAGLELESIELGETEAKFELILDLHRAGEEVLGTLSYNAELFDRTTVLRLARQYEALASQFLDHPERRFSEFPTQTASERHQALWEWNDTATSYPREASIPAIFAAVARSRPEAPALEFGERRWSYRQLSDRARRCAAALRSRGVGRETLVGVYMLPSPEMVAGILAILEAGGAYLPLDPDYPAERLTFMVEDAGLELVVTEPGLGEQLPQSVGGRPLAQLLLDSEYWQREAAAEAGVSEPASFDPDQLAYVTYTSGSTGLPKGIAVTHRAVLRLVLDTDYVRLGPGGRVAQMANVSFDAATFELWGPLLTGATVVGIPRRTLLAPAELGRALVELEITVAFLTTAVFNQVAQETPQGFAGVRHLLVGGEAMDPRWPREVLAHGASGGAFPGRLHNIYGPTENTTFSTCHLIRELPPETRSVPIGKPIANSTGYVCDRTLHPVPLGGRGELLVGGDGLARGYHRRPALTAERFVPAPGLAGGARLYRTGDLVRRLRGGELDYLGRFDHQIKLRGFRIELGEIEAALLAHPEVKGAVVALRGERSDDRRLVAWVVPREAADKVTEAVLHTHLRHRLSEYMVPAAIVLLDTMPLNAHGKIDRRALPEPLGVRPELEEYVAPRTPEEEVMAEIFAEMLALKRVGVNDDFFALGGHSLLATRLISRVRESFAVELPLSELFERPTPAALTLRAVAVRRAGSAVEAPPIEPVARDQGFPLSFAQQRLWLIDQLRPGNPAYNVPFALRMSGELRPEVLTRTLTEIVARHEILRTTFDWFLGVPSQLIEDPAPFTLPQVDLSRLAPTCREAEGRRLAAADAGRSFDLALGPLLRVTLVRLGGDEHLLLVNMHHIVSDGWSIGVMVEELSALYRAFAAGRRSPLPPLAVQYADFAVWQRRWLTGEVLASGLDYWRGVLGDSPEPLELPVDRPWRPLMGARCGLVQVRLGRCATAIQKLGWSHGATPFMVLLAAFAALLHRVTAQPVIHVGTPISGRNRREVEPLIGFFVNTLVVRSQLAGDPRLAEVLERLRETLLGAFAHQEVPFEKLVEELQPERDLSRHPLFQVAFTFNQQRPDVAGLEMAGLALESLELGETEAKFELILDLYREGKEVLGTLSYNSELYDRTTALRLARQYEVLVSQLLDNPLRRFFELPAQAVSERHQALWEWNDTVTSYPRDASIPAIFAAVARSRPEAPALEFGTRRWSYRRLHDRARSLAAALRALGVGSDTLVGVYMLPSPEMIAGILAILEAGGAYLPLDPDYPAERLAFMAQDAGLALVVTEPKLGEQLPRSVGGRTLEQLILDPEYWRREGVAEGAMATSESAPIDPDQLAYVTYTSGSTGLPKGIAVPHRAVLRLVLDTDYVQLAPGSRVAQVANISFDAATFELWGALLTGATLVGIPRRTLLAPAELGRALVELEITAMFLTAAVFNHVAQETPQSFAGVRHLLVGGEAVDPRWAREVLEHGAPGGAFPGRLYNGYGPTENTTFSICHLIRELSPETRSVPIGRPIANSTGYVFDRGLRPVPLGGRGELLVGGDGLARGYHRRPALTAERFVPAPGLAGGARLYRTGDLVRRLRGGELDYLGRFDHQVKLRGFRIELGEIEAALVAHPATKEAVVMLRGERSEDRRLVAWVVLRTALEKVTEAVLHTHLRHRLPEYMVPAAFVFLDAMPLNANGKIDRQALPNPLGVRPELEGHVAPRTPEEEMMAEIFAEVLALERVGVTEDFFDLGGHSLLATRLISRVRESFAVELPLSELFERPTPAALAFRVAAVRRAGGIAEAPPIEPVARDQSFPLSFAQQRLWLIDQLRPGNPAYNVPFALRMCGELRPEVLTRALTEIVARHEVLRTTFDWFLGVPSQLIEDPAPFSLPQVDLSRLAPAGGEAEGRRLAAADMDHSFDLALGPLLRVVLVRLNRGEHLLLVNMHHIVSDGWSIGVMVEELSTLYQAFAAGRRSPLPPLPVQYVDFAVWQRKWLRDEVLETELGYWKQILGSSPEPLDIPADRPRPKLASFRAGSQPLSLPGAAAALRPLLRGAGVTPFITLLAAFQLLLHRLSGQEAIRVGTPVSGRTRGEIERLIGFFVNTLVVQVDFADEDGESPSFDRLLERVRKATLGAFDHQELPFEKLVEELQPERDTSRQPLFQAFFTYRVEEQSMPELPGLVLAQLAVESTESKFDIALGITAIDDDLVGSLDYQADLFDATTMARMARHFKALVSGLVADSQRPISELPFLAAAERHQLCIEWGDRGWEAAAFDADTWTPAWRVFVAQAERTPEVTALVAGARELTYAELDRWSNQIAHHLRRQGVRSGTLVGLCLRRDAGLVAGLLGIWKAGGAYLPLDPYHPTVRLRFLITDALMGEDATPRVLTSGDLVKRLREAAPEQLIPILLEEASGESAALPATTTAPEDLAYLLYTSGTTGQPKGVMVEQRNLSAFLEATRREFGVAAGRMPLIAPLSFDIFLFELLSPLLAGGAAVLLGLEPTLDLDQLVDELTRATQFHAVPSVVRRVVDMVRKQQGEGDWNGVRRIFVGGDKVSAELLADLREVFPAARTRVLYGPTETSILATSYPVPTKSVVRGAPLGRPLPGVVVELRDLRGELVPIGVVGEIRIGGAGVTRGYLGRAQLTAERYLEYGEQRWYRTGDRARWGAGGDLEFLGRFDEQVKVRGMRIELGEIESVLSEHPTVAAAAAAVWEGADGELRLAGYVVRASDRPLLEDDLLTYLRQRLPGYMVPASILELGELPLTRHGKVDRKALPNLAAEAEGQYVAPRNPTEERLAKLWEQLIPAQQVGVHDNFFKLGGHSLLATQLVSRIRQELAVELPLRELFEFPTVAEMARAIERARAAGPTVAAPPLTPVSRDRELPLSFAQQRLWFIDQLEPGTPAYNLPYFIGLDGPLDLAALEHSIDSIVARHEVLRTTFVAEEGKEPVQRIAPPRHRPLPLVDLASLPAEARRGESRRLAFQEIGRSFDLGRGPVLQMTVLHLAPEEHLAMLNLHHIVSDAWSLEVFVSELRTFYSARIQHEEPQLPELPVQYADFAVWQRQWLQGEVIERMLAYWKKELAGDLPVLRLPMDRPRPEVRSFRGGIVASSYGQLIHQRLLEIGQREGTTLYMTLLAAFQAFLSRLTGQEDLVLGTALAGRGQQEVANLIGFFINMLPVRADLTGDPSFVELLRRSREKILGVFAHQDLPLDRLIEELRPERRGSYMPLFQAAFGLRAAFRQDLELAGLELRPVSFDYDTARLDLSLWMLESEDGLSATWFYSNDVFDRETVERLSRRFATFLGSLAQSPEAWISTHQILDQQERDALAQEQAKSRQSKLSKLKTTRRKIIAVPQEVGE